MVPFIPPITVYICCIFQRSRHGSGASTGSARTKRTDSNELKKRPSLSTFKEFQTDSMEDPSGEEEWHLELRSLLIFQYIKYLQTIGFHYVQMDKSQDKGKVKKRFEILIILYSSNDVIISMLIS